MHHYFLLQPSRKRTSLIDITFDFCVVVMTHTPIEVNIYNEVLKSTYRSFSIDYIFYFPSNEEFNCHIRNITGNVFSV